MAQNSKQELVNIQNELRSIIAQITTISDDLKSNHGISIERCAQSLDNISQDYKLLISKLERVNLDTDINSGGGRF